MAWWSRRSHEASHAPDLRNERPEPEPDPTPERATALIKAWWAFFRESLRVVIPGLIAGGLVSVSHFRNNKSINPANWYEFRGVASSDAITWIGALLAMIVALNLALAATPKISNDDSPEQVAARWVWTSVLVCVMRISAASAVGLAAAEFVPGGPASSVGSKSVAVLLTIVSVAITGTTVPMTESQERSLVTEFQRVGQRDRVAKSIANVTSAMGNRRPTRPSWLSYLLWTSTCGIVGLLVLFVPDGLMYGSSYFHDWWRALPDLGIILLFVAAGVAGLLLAVGSLVTLKWRDGFKFRRLVPLTTFALATSGLIAYMVAGAFVNASMRQRLELEAFVIVTMAAPFAALVVAYRWQRGPGLVALRAAEERWRAEQSRLDADIQRNRQDRAA